MIANIYMEGFEEALNTAADQPSLWVLYVDDTFIIRPHGPDKLENFHSHNKSIQYTVKKEHNHLPFLDVLEGNHMSTSIYREATQISTYTMSLITI